MTRTLPAPTAPLSAHDLTMLRRMLEEQRAFRVDQLRQLHHPGVDAPLSITDPEIVASLVAGARSALHDVQAALWRMDEGRYGRCVRCGQHIETARLEILPATPTCLSCQRDRTAAAGRE